MHYEMIDALADLSNNEFLKYTLSTAVGFVGAFGVQWLRDRRTNDRIRDSARQGLAEELANNLEVLDLYEATFRRGLAEGATGYVRWPAEQLTTAMLHRCLDPLIGALLSPGERSKVPTVYYNLIHL